MAQLKPISPAGVPAALQKAERYRLLNDSSAAESICLDILVAEPDNQTALVMLLLAISDQFPTHSTGLVRRAREVAAKLADEYKRFYYSGIISERQAKAQLHRGAMGAADIASGLLHEAMSWYERAEALRPAGNDEAILRWNTCVRLLARHERANVPTEYEPALEE